MDEESERLSNLCADLVSFQRFEPAVVRLFREKRAGDWVPVRELYEAVGPMGDGIKPGLFAAWLPAPGPASDYAVILFFDDETLWSTTAYYNVSRLMANADRSAAPRG